MALVVSASIVVLAATAGWTQTKTTTAPKAKADPKINEPFKKPNVREYTRSLRRST
jgi:hypothetical protein